MPLSSKTDAASSPVFRLLPSGACRDVHDVLKRALLALGLFLAACQPLPRPLAEPKSGPLAPVLALKDSYGIAVQPVGGAPAEASKGLAEAMASALRDAGIPASTQGHNRASYVLTGAAREEALPSGRVGIVVDWDLKGPKGIAAGQSHARAEGSAAAWQSGSPALMKTLAQASAPATAKLIQEDAPVAAPDAPRPRIFVRQVAGAPGDGTRSLTRAVIEALRRVDLQATAATDAPPAKGSLTVMGTVTVGPAVSGKQKVTVTWEVSGADGNSLGKVGQENSIPAGLLDGTWGEIALAVAEAATDGILSIVERVEQDARS